MNSRSWFFQANPKIYRLRDALNSLSQIRWSVNQYANEIKAGDTVYLWESGPAAGILAQGRILSDPAIGQDSEQEAAFYVNQSNRNPTLGVNVQIDRVLDPYVSRSLLLLEPVLEDTLILKSAMGTNFPIKEAETKVLKGLLISKPTFQEIVTRYRDEKIVFSSFEKGAQYAITDVDAAGYSVSRLSAQESERVTFALYDDRLAKLQQTDLLNRAALSNTVAVSVSLLQSSELAWSVDRNNVLTLRSNDHAIQVFIDYIRALNVDRSSVKPKLYKPGLLAATIEAIADQKIVDHQIHFDVVLPYFLKWMNRLGIEAGEDQAALAFFHLTGDLFWNLSYKDLQTRVESGAVTPASIRAKVSHAVLKEPFRWILRWTANRNKLLLALEEAWWPNVEEPIMGRKFWWVNQGKSYEKDRDQGVLWAAQADKNGATYFHWDNLSKVKPGDIVFHYANQSISAVSCCSAAGEKALRPEAPTDWQKNCWLVKTEYTEVSNPLPLASVAKPIRRLDFKYGPINKSDGVNQGYLYEIPPAAARTIAEQLQLSEFPQPIREPLENLISQQWDEFIKWGKSFWEDPQIRETETSYKIEAGNLLAAAYQELQKSGDWFKPLKRAFQGENNLTDFRSQDNFLKWCKANTDDAERLLNAVWNPNQSDAEAVELGLSLMGADVIKGPGTRNNIISFLAMGRDATRCPIYKTEPFEKGPQLTGFQSIYHLKENELYPHALAFLDRIKKEAESRGLILNDRLAAQSILWCITKYEPRETWSDEDRQKFLNFRAGHTNPPGPVRPDPWKTLAESLYLDVAFLKEVSSLIQSKNQVIFYGPPGTGKTYVAKALAKHLATGDGQVEIVQFHPSYAYEDFVEGFRPHLNDGQAGFRLARGPLRRLAAKARKHPSSTFVLLIDEINRGNVAKIFGELYFLLEYRDEDISLQYSRKRFSLPSNLWIIGTMNTADRSIAMIDAALRRRFYFVPFFPDELPVSQVLRRWLKDKKPSHQWLADVVDLANTKLANRHAAIGPSYFMRADLNDDWLKLIWKHAITPYLAEQFFGNEEQVKEYDLEKLRNALTASNLE